MAQWTRLGTRGPAAGFAVVFPDALERVWDDHGCGRRDGADDAAFAARLIEHLRRKGAAGDRPAFLVGLSNGACFAERLARAALVDAGGIALICGTGRVASRKRVPAPLHATAVLAMLGTKDSSMPYAGGASTSWVRGRAHQRVRLGLLETSDHEAVGADTLTADWAAINGAAGTPAVESLPASEAGELPVQRLTWPEDRDRADARPVVLYRIEGGGHGWPGARTVLPRFVFGRIPRRLDATGIVLDFAGNALTL